MRKLQTQQLEQLKEEQTRFIRDFVDWLENECVIVDEEMIRSCTQSFVDRSHLAIRPSKELALKLEELSQSVNIKLAGGVKLKCV